MKQNLSLKLMHMNNILIFITSDVNNFFTSNDVTCNCYFCRNYMGNYEVTFCTDKTIHKNKFKFFEKRNYNALLMNNATKSEKIVFVGYFSLRIVFNNA